MIPGTSGWKSLLNFWLAPQIGLPRVIRWEKYTRPENGGTRRQNSLQHSHSIVLLAIDMLNRLSQYLPDIDREMVITAVAVHDLGEIEEGDTLYIDKTVQGDVAEWESFAKLTDARPPETRLPLQQAFLLQFCLNEDKYEAFPPEARKIMAELADHYRIEALLFEAVERIDYVLYAQEQLCDRGAEKILVQTLRHQMHHLERLAAEIPGFGKEIWTEEDRAWHQAFLNQHEGRWIERKSA